MTEPEPPEAAETEPQPNRTVPKIALVVALLFLAAFIYNIIESSSSNDTDPADTSQSSLTAGDPRALAESAGGIIECPAPEFGGITEVTGGREISCDHWRTTVTVYDSSADLTQGLARIQQLGGRALVGPVWTIQSTYPEPDYLEELQGKLGGHINDYGPTR